VEFQTRNLHVRGVFGVMSWLCWLVLNDNYPELKLGEIQMFVTLCLHHVRKYVESGKQALFQGSLHIYILCQMTVVRYSLLCSDLSSNREDVVPARGKKNPKLDTKQQSKTELQTCIYKTEHFLRSISDGVKKIFD
jgi:hypothetical protein